MQLFSYVVLNIMVLLSSLAACRFMIKFSSSRNKPQYYVIYTVIQVAVGYFCFNTKFYMSEIVDNLLGVMIVILFCRFLLKVDFHTALLTALLKEAVFGICNTVAFAFSGILLRETRINEYIILTLSSVFILVLSIGAFELFIRRYGRNGKWSGKYGILYICPLTCIYFITVAILNVAYNPVEVSGSRMHYSTTTVQDMEIFLAIGISLASIYVILYFYEKVMAQIEIQKQMSALEAFTEIQKQYINEARQKYENTKVFRHDMNNHMITLAGLIKNHETGKAMEYLGRFDEEVKKLSFEVFTGNTVIDVILKEKLGYAKEHGIKIICDAQIPNDFIVDDFDLCIIFFNALDNAIKGCEYADEKMIDIVAKKNKDFFVIDIINSFNAGKYQKGTGIGLETIRFITERYGGYLETGTENGNFRVSIMFYLT